MNHLFTFSFREARFQVWQYLFKKSGTILLTAIVVVLLCEVYFRLPFLPEQLEYQPDSELAAEFRGTQKGYMWLGNMSFKSPAITINSDGHRGRETDWYRPVILAAGDSEAFGAGVEDSEIWTAHLEEYLRNQFEIGDVQVANIAHPGQGPYHHYVRIKRALRKAENVLAIIVRVDIGDRYFRQLTDADLLREVRAATIRQIARRYTKGLPYLYNKITAQVPNIKSALIPGFSKKGQKTINSQESVGHKMWEENRKWWEGMEALCRQKEIALIFMVHDLADTDASKTLEAHLSQLSAAKSKIYVLRLGPCQFGLGKGEASQHIGNTVNKLVLERDPHASPLQHELMARAVMDFIIRKKLIAEMPAQ